MIFENGKKLALTDYQRNARIIVNPEPAKAPDALSPEVNLTFWKNALKSKATIKNLLLDQNVIRGIGNAYADEILWEAGISPFSVSNKIPAEKVKALAKAVKKVLTSAIKQIGKAEPGIIGGEIRDFLNIHNADKKTSPTGAVIKHKTIGGRKTYFTDEQELY
jgi:formamidopyrimidine-DNA glycosylase